MKNRFWLCLFAAASLLLVAFIWGNSLKPVPQSFAQSEPIVQSLKPMLDPQENLGELQFHDYVRKSAHLVEFAALGLCIGGFCICLGREQKRRLISLPILLVLLVAVGDEYIQHFAGRGSAVTDVVLDFSGALAGLLIAAVFCWLRTKIKPSGN